MSNIGLTTLQDINKLKNLQKLACVLNPDISTLNLSNMINLTYVECQANNISTLNISGLVNLQTLYCNNNNLSELIASNLLNLKYLNCAYNKLTALDISGLTALQSFYCNKNNLVLLPTLTSKNLISNYSFTYNDFSNDELNRFRSLGFTNETKLIPQNSQPT